MHTANKKIETFRPACRQGYEPSRRHFIFCLLITALLCLTAASNTASAATYYLDAVNGNDSNPGTSAAPWRAMDKVRTSTNPGDTLIILNVHEDTFTADWPEGLTYKAKGVTQFGITWTFKQEDPYYTIGRFANGDYWVVGPVTIIGIDPASTKISGRAMHGSMVNPKAGESKHGYDSSVIYGGPYDATLNVARPNGQDLTELNPLVIPLNSSLISTISWDEAGRDWTQVKAASILTILDDPAPEGGFRPSYSGNDKTIKFNKNQLDYSLLANLAITPDISAVLPRLEQQAGDVMYDSVERTFERPWLDHAPGWSAHMIFASYNMPNYGREIGTEVGKAALMLNLDFTNEQKETLLIRFVQLGIDNFGIVQDGGSNNWRGDGGHGSGRKWPILFAGLMLNDEGMKNIGVKSGSYLYSNGHHADNQPSDYIHFGEDDQTFYVEDRDVQRCINSETGEYYTHENPPPGTSEYCNFEPFHWEDLGLPDWRKYCTINWETKAWEAGYRGCCTANAWAGFLLAAHIMEEKASAKTLWNHDTLFDYQDRYMEVEADDPEEYSGVGGYHRQTSRFVEKMWDAYRANYGCIWTRNDPTDIYYSNGSNPCASTSDTIPPLAPTNLTRTAQTENSISLSWTAPGPASDGDLASAYKIYRDDTLLETVTTTSFEDGGLAANTSYSYDVYSVDDAGNQSVSAATGTFSTSSDTTAPSIVSVSASESSLEIVFNETLDTISAEDINNYSITGGISVIAASLDTETVTLSTSSHAEGSYTLTVENVQDTSGNPMTETTTDYQYNDGLAGYWKFNDGDGISALDSSGNSNTATLINGPVWTGQGELSFDGIDDYVEVPDSDYLDIESQITLSVWVRLTNYRNDWPKIIIKPFEAYEAPWELFSLDLGHYGDRARFTITDGVPAGSGATVVNNNNLFALNEWYHITAAYNGALMSLYVDGELIATQETTIQIGTNNMPLGIGGRLGINSFNGLIDEVRIYNRALIADEVSNLALVFLPIDDKQIEEGSTLTFEVRTKDPNQEVLIESHSLPSDPVFFLNGGSWTFSWTPQYGDAGSYEVTFEAPHGEFVDFETITITVHKPTRPVYRFWSPINSRHFYTIKEAEKDKLIDIYAHVWTYESIAYYAFVEDSEPALVPVYRFWSPVLVAHFYTISESEKQKLIDRYSHVWTYEGIAFYAYPEGQQPGDAEEVYRFWSPVLETHFYTISESEKNKLVDNYQHVWTYEGTAWYAYTSY